MADKRNNVPLNVKTYKEGFLRLQGWTVFSCIAFFTAGLLVMYELLVINVEDQDFRDMLFDYRITRPGINYQHKRFVNAHYCCNQDSAVHSYTCPRPFSNFSDYWGSDTPPCPPTIQFTCPDLTSSNCNKVRAAVYAAAGLDVTGKVVNCSRAGQVLLRARAASGYRLTASVQGSQLSQQLVLDPNSIDTREVDTFVAQVAAAHSDPMFFLPSEPLGRSLRINGALVQLKPQLQDPSDDKWGDFGWPWELWPWPPSAACSNTGQPATLHLEGTYKAHFAAFEPSKVYQPSFAVTLLGNTLSVPQYQQQQLPAPQQGARPAVDGLAAAAAAAEETTMVVVNTLTGVNISVGLAPQLGACQAWQLQRPSLSLAYSREVWRGSSQELAALRKPITAGNQVLTLSVRDVAEPLPLALPRYGGELYVYVALVLGGVWMFSTVPLIVMFGVVLINVQRNRGLPIFLYRYMRKYRGW